MGFPILRKQRRLKRVIVLSALMLAGCVTIGRRFPADSVQSIRLGETTREEIRRMFGEPWRTGLEDGHPTWTFGYYRYSLFGSEETRDLVVTFDGHGLVRSYSYNASHPDGE